LWRVFKIIEEFSSGAADEITELQERVEELEAEHDRMAKGNQELRFRTRSVNGSDAGNTAGDG